MPDLEPVLLEFRRVLRPDGNVVLSDIHPLNTILGGGLAGFPDEDITKGIPYVLNRTHPIADYIAAFRAAVLDDRRLSGAADRRGPAARAPELCLLP